MIRKRDIAVILGALVVSAAAAWVIYMVGYFNGLQSVR